MNPAKPIIYRPSAEALLAAFHASGKRHLIITGARGSGKTTLLQNFLRLQYPEREDGGNCPFPFDLPGFTSWAVRKDVRDGFSETDSSLLCADHLLTSCEDIYATVPSCIRLFDHCSRQSAIIGLPSETASATLPDHCSQQSAVIGLPSRAASASATLPDHCSRQSAVIELPSQNCEIAARTADSPYPAHNGTRMRAVPDGFLTVGLGALQNALCSPGAVAVLDEIGYLEESVPAFCDAIWELFEKKNVVAVLRDQASCSAAFTGRLRSRDDVFAIDLSTPFPHIGAVVMASGEGRRYRARSEGYKLLASFHGEPLLAPALRTASIPLIRSRIAVTRSPEVRNLCQAFDFPCILHDQPLLSDTIRISLMYLCGISENTTQQYDIAGSGLPPHRDMPENAMQQHDSARSDLPPHRGIPDGCIFFQGDQPLVSPVSIEALILAFTNDPQKIYRLASHGTPGSPVLFPRTFFQELMQLPPDCGGNVVIRRHPEAVQLIEAQDALELLDADTPEELRALTLYRIPHTDTAPA